MQMGIGEQKREGHRSKVRISMQQRSPARLELVMLGLYQMYLNPWATRTPKYPPLTSFKAPPHELCTRGIQIGLTESHLQLFHLHGAPGRIRSEQRRR